MKLIKRGYTLKFAIGVFVLVAVILTAAVCGFSAIKANKKSLKSTYLQNNFQYAKKISSETSNAISDMQESIIDLASKEAYKKTTHQELDNLLKVNKKYFNSMFIANEDRVVQQISPEVNGINVGTPLASQQALEAIKLKRPLISEPYVGKTGRNIVLISAPIFNKDGDYKGFVAGSIYLEENNIISNMLNEHYFGNGSYLYVVDREGDLIFHPDKKRIGENVIQNDVVKKVTSGKTGYQQVRNSLGIDFLVGYSYESKTGWGIISQTPLSVLEAPVKSLVKEILMLALPIILLLLVVAWLVSNRISKPLHDLTKYSEEAIEFKSKKHNIPRPKTNIYEVKQLYHHINRHISLLNNEIQIDGLTGLANRRAFDQTIKEWLNNNVPLSLILLDIDHFKRVNDTFGHLVGDDVLRFLASEIAKVTRSGDLCFRYGGEEFGILIKTNEYSEALGIAERLRRNVENSLTPTGEYLTVSIGIAIHEGNAEGPIELIKKADEALYESKRSGRNKSTIYSLS